MTTPKPDWVKGEWGCSYEDIVTSWGYSVIASDTFGQYQGDLVFFLSDGDRVGLLVIGYGSCSGCDALQAAEPWDSKGDWTAVVELAAAFKKDIRWFDSNNALREHVLKAVSDKQEWYYCEPTMKEWIVAAVKAMP